MTSAADRDTIAAIATPSGKGGIGVVRVSGAKLSSLIREIIGAVPAGRSATFSMFLGASGEPIDEGIALYFPAPHSYTGEDVLELHGHGGPVVMQMLLRRCLELGARLAQPGEFTRRAFLNDKLDLTQAEGVADIIEAATEAAVRCALRSVRGEFSAVIEELVNGLVELRVFIEATLDFPEEEIAVADRADILGRLARLRQDISNVITRARQGSILRNGLQIVLIGRPNVGKSSILNRLAGEDIAIVTSLPGTTRDTLRETIEIGGIPINIVDTAGLREPGDEIESLGIARTWRAIERADALLLVVEAATGIAGDDRDILARLPKPLPRITVFNKIDLFGDESRIEVDGSGTSIWLSAKTGTGLELLRASLLQLAGWQTGGEDIFMARERHLAALGRAADFLREAVGVAGHFELLAEELRLAHRELGEITGLFSADDLLGEIFSRFCVGK